MKIEDGKEYVGTDGSVKLVKYIGESVVAYISNGCEYASTVVHAEKYWRPKPVEREKITLYECINFFGSIFFLTNEMKEIDTTQKEVDDHVFKCSQKIPNGRTIEIYADDYTMVKE